MKYLPLIAACLMLNGCSTLSPDPQGEVPFRPDINFRGNRNGPGVSLGMRNPDGKFDPYFRPYPSRVP